MNIYGIIYKVTNLSNGKVYIGQTVRSLEDRKIEHIRDSKTTNYSFYYAIRKYGLDNFNWSIIDSGYSKDELDDKEVFWIDYYKSYCKRKDSNGYNMTIGGNSLSGKHNPFYGKKHSDESRKNMSEKAKGRRFTPASRKKLSESLINRYKYKKHNMCGKKHSDATKMKMSNSKMGKKISDTHKENISKAKMGDKNPMSKGVIQLSFEGRYISEYATVKEASDKVGGYSTHIVNCCKGKLKSYKNCIWVYESDYCEDHVQQRVAKCNGLLKCKRHIVQLTLEGKFVAFYDSANKGALSINGSKSSISKSIIKCCKGEKESYKQYKWMYKDIYESQLEYKELITCD